MRCSFGVGFRRLRSSFFLLLGIAMASPSIAAAIAADENAAESADSDSAKSDPDARFSDGWRKEVLLAEPDAQGKAPRCMAWVDEGWLIVGRPDTAGDVEWQIVLAQVGEGDEPQAIERNPDVPGGLRLDYRGGRFFIHDDWSHLRCMRQKKSADMRWPAIKIPPSDDPLGEARMYNQTRIYYCRTHDGWQHVAHGQG